MKSTFELIVKDDVQNILDHFCAAFGVRIIFCSPDGQTVRAGLDRPDSEYCRLIQGELYGAERCATLDLARQAEAARSKAPLRYQCHAGLVEVIAPVYLGGQLIGFAIIGQIRRARGMPASVYRDWAKAPGRDGAKLREAFDALPFLQDKAIDHVVALLLLIVDYIVSKEMIAFRGNVLIERALAYLRENVGRSVGLEELAEGVGKSVSTLTHAFRTVLGSSFKQVSTGMKIEEAERLFDRLDAPTVGEVAARVGYEDQFQFSRIYKKYRGYPPVDYLRKARPR